MPIATGDLFLITSDNHPDATLVVDIDEYQHMRRLLSLDCDEMQGFLFNKPVPAEILEAKFLTPRSPDKDPVCAEPKGAKNANIFNRGVGSILFFSPLVRACLCRRAVHSGSGRKSPGNGWRILRKYIRAEAKLFGVSPGCMMPEILTLMICPRIVRVT